jgi:histidinol-phosphate aminotransferase
MSSKDNQYVHLAAPGVANLNPYVPGKPVSELERELGISDSVKLASNENPLGCSPMAIAAIGEELAEVARYPDGGGFELRAALAEKHAVDAGCVTLGNGSNDVLDMIARVFLGPGRESLFSQHAFAVYPISSQAVGADLKVAPARDYGHDLEVMAELISDRTGVIWIANPNNPTGNWLASGELRAFIAAVPENVIVVVDEAYIEYVQEEEYPDASAWLRDFPNMIVTRTFSKAYGLASLRVGYGLSHPDIADLLNRVRQPFNVNTMALAAACAALKDADFIRRAVEVNSSGMAQLETGFREMGLEFIPSVGNFITVDVGRPGPEVDQALLRQGCIVRPVANYGLPNHLRVSIGLPEENARLLAAMKKVLEPC